MAFPSNPVEGQSYTENNTVWIYSAVTGQWNRSVISQVNETTYIGADGAPSGIGGDTQVIFNSNGSFAGDSGLTYNKTTDALTSGSLKVTSLGTAAAPAISVTGDPNTGIYSPGADQVAVATNGAGRLYLSNNQHVSQGASAPLGGSGSFFLNYQIRGAGNQVMTLFGQTNAGAGGLLSNGYHDSSDNIRYGLGSTNSGISSLYMYNGAFIFSSAPDGTSGSIATTTERLRITSDGKVGIGTSSPGTRLCTYDTASGNDTQFRVGFNDSYAWDISRDNAVTGDLTFKNSAGGGFAERVRITAAGRLGIGTTSPSNSLHVALSGVTGPKIRLQNTNATSNNSELLFAGPGGNIGGIYVDSAGSGGVDINLASTNASGSIRFGVGASAEERARIDSSGRLLVGTSTSRSSAFGAANFQLENASALHSLTQNAANQFGGAYILAKTRGTGFETVVNNDNLGILSWQGSNGTVMQEGARIQADVDGVVSGGGVYDLPTRLVFSTTADGASSPTERMRITSTGQLRLAGAGITFNGDTAAANELDDYEEGTWTPTIAGQTTTGTGTYSVQSGRYTKVGRSVYVAGTVAWSAHDGTGNMRIAGLPFTALNVTELANAVSFTYVSDITIPANSIPIGGVFPNNTFVTLYSMAVAGGTPNGLGMDGSGTIYFSLTYQTA